MTRVELLLEKVLQKLDGANGAASPNQFTALSTSEAATPADNAPVLSLFQNEIVSVYPFYNTGLLLMVFS